MKKASWLRGMILRNVIFWAVILVMLLIGGTLLFLKTERNVILQNKSDELISISNLKIRELEHWITERKDNARYTVMSPGFINASQAIKTDQRNEQATTEILKRFQLLQSIYQYDHCHLVDETGKIMATTNPGMLRLDSLFLPTLHQTRQNQSVTISDFIHCQAHQAIHLVVIAPVSGDSREPSGYLVLHSDPEKYLYPLVQEWPTTSKTAETILIEQDGDSVVFLNELRHQRNTALKLRIALNSDEVPSVKAVSGVRGMVHGTDYRGKPVYAYISAIENTPWLMISKVDEHEMYAELRNRALMVGITSLSIILFIFGGAMALIRWRQRDHFRSLYRKERELWESQQEFRTTLYSIGDAVIATNCQGVITLMNPIAEQLTGWTEQEAMGLPLQEVFSIINENTREKAENPVERVIREGKIIGLANHTLLISRNGQEFPIADAGAPIFDQERQLQGVVLVFRDQTAERKALQMLQESEERFKSVFESSNAGKSMTHITGEMDANEAFCSMLGYTRHELKSKRWQELTPQEEIKAVEEILQTLLNGEKNSVRFTKRYIRKDGSILWTDIGIVIRRDAEGNPLHFITNVIDITEQVKSTEALRKSEEKFSIAFRSSPYAITLTKIDTGEIIDINEGFVAITGYTREESVGKTTPEMGLWASIDDRNEVVAELQRSGKVRNQEYRFRIKGGNLICGIFSAEIIQIDNQPYVLSSINDITSRKQMEEELVSAKDRAEESDRLKSIFLANMSHEIRTPMNAILGFSSLLNDPSFGEEEREVFMERINGAGRRLLQIINDIIDISKLESRQLNMHTKGCHLASIVYHSIDEIQTSAIIPKKRNISLGVDIPPELEELEILTDPLRLQQVMVNLLSNAVKYTEEGSITAGFRVMDEPGSPCVEFFVSDTGRGIPPEKLELIFERFRQAEENEYHEGTGLGLSIAKGIVELLGGKISVTSTPGQGSTFRVSIPYLPSKSPAFSITKEQGGPLSLRGRTVVIAEDDLDSFLYLKNLIEPTQAVVVHAADGEALMKYLTGHKADLVLLDLKMPGKSGWDCMKEIRLQNLPVRVIAQTAYAFPDDQQRCLKEGCDGYLAKPLTKTDLFALIRKVMGS